MKLSHNKKTFSKMLYKCFLLMKYAKNDANELGNQNFILC